MHNEPALTNSYVAPLPCRHRYRANRWGFFAFLLIAPSLAFSQVRDNNADDAFLPSPVRTVSTVPANGDVNPYGVAFVPRGFSWGAGPLRPGDILVSNFNSSQNLQGTGTTIVRVSKSATPAVSTFFQGIAPLGLSTALGVLKSGLVLVGNFPTSDGTCATAKAGSLIIVNNVGKRLEALTDAKIQGPWDMALVDHGSSAIAFVANALNGTVIKLDLKVTDIGLSIVRSTVIASGYRHRCDPVALVVAPTGLVYDEAKDVLYVASTEDNAIYKVENALNRTDDDDGPGDIIYRDQIHLHGPLGMIMAPNGHLIVANSDVINSDPHRTSELTEFTTKGQFVKQLSVDPAAGGSFGLAVQSSEDQATFAAVDDNASTLTVWNLNVNLLPNP